MCNSYCQICCNKQLILLKIIITIIAKIGYGVGNFWWLVVKGYDKKRTTKHQTKYTTTRRWHVTISCHPDGRPPQPVRPWKSGRVHLAEGSNVVVLELPYSTEFGRESRTFASGVRKYGKFDDGR